ESYFSAYLTLWFPLLIWWTPLCRMLQIMTRRFTLYAYGCRRKTQKSCTDGLHKKIVDHPERNAEKELSMGSNVSPTCFVNGR
ncbi:hypothetical protein, partial [Enterobacter asburiae]